jgi:aryl-alcohol dehydrogenase-like predicted oxidoreductase
MGYTQLGNSGLKVSRLALGCMNFGTPNDYQNWSPRSNGTGGPLAT